MTLFSLDSFDPRKLLLSFSLLILIVATGHAQQAQFSADVVSGCAPLTVKFTDHSTGGATSWKWDFGNSNTSDLQDPGAIYSSAGTYTVKLTINNGADIETKIGFITVYANPKADFTFDKNTGCAPLPVTFTDKSTPGSGAITQWLWVFGDGGTDTRSNPQHTYEVSGPKTIALKVTNQYGCENTGVKTSAIQVLGPKVTFTADNSVFCQVPATVTFNNTSTGDAPLTYSWNFGDGKTSTQKSPSKTFTDDGVFTTTLIVTDKNKCTSQGTMQINAGGEDGLSIQASASKICIGQPVTFVAQTTTVGDIITSYEWNFGDTTFSTAASPTTSYQHARNHVVTLKAQIQGRTCKSIVTIPVEVIPNPVPTFTYTSDCNYKVTFTSTSKNASKVFWELSNGLTFTQPTFSFTYPAPGSYSVRLTAFNELDCSITVEKVIQVIGKPIAAFTPNTEQSCTEPSLSGCVPFTIQFKNESAPTSGLTYKWNFGDNSSSTTKSPGHTYKKVGNFTVSLDVKNSAGCTGRVTAKVVVSNITPVAKFTLSKKSVCEYETVNFTDQSTSANFWCWDFGDGATSTAQHPSHSYDKPGTYTVTLTAKNGGCSNTFQIVNAVTVKNPLVEFKIAKNCLDPYAVQLINTSANYTSLLWDFGDGQTTSSNVSKHIYADTGQYIIKLTGVNTATQCTVTVQTSVDINDLDVDFEIDNPKPCRDADVTFTDKSASAVKWEWDFGNTQYTSDQDAITKYHQGGQFTATLRAYDADGCSATKSVTVNVLDIDGKFNFTGASTCSNLTAKFSDQSTASPAVNGWHWDFGDGQTSTQKDPTHVYQALGSYPITLTLTNDNGTCSFIQYGAVNFTVPGPAFISDKQGLCLNSPVQFINQTVNGVTYAWDFGNGETSAAGSPQMAYTATGEYDITLKATDQFGCEKTVIKQQYISVTKPTAGFDDTKQSVECPPLVATFVDQSVGSIAKWEWDLGDGQTSTLQTPNCVYARPGDFDVTLVVTDVNGCTDTKVAPKVVSVGGPYGTFEVTEASRFCLYDTAIFAAQTTNAITHRWDFGDGNVVDMTENNARHRYDRTGAIQISLVLIDVNGCQVLAEGSRQVVVQDTTTIDMIYSPCIFAGEETYFEATPQQDGMTYSWTVDGYAAGAGSAIPAMMNTTGKHPVRLNAINVHGCPSTLQYELPVQGDVDFVPNVFTPNTDDLNPVFEIRGLELSHWDLHVYNRWGEEVYKKRDYKNSWNGDGLATGVYYYHLENSFCPDRDYKGSLTIIR